MKSYNLIVLGGKTECLNVSPGASEFAFDMRSKSDYCDLSKSDYCDPSRGDYYDPNRSDCCWIYCLNWQIGVFDVYVDWTS